MIYKFIDNNGSELTVNSLSSLQALVDSETIKKTTKVKAGLRGKWTTAENIPDLVFEEKEKNQTQEKVVESEEDIKSFITKEKPKEEVKKIPEKKITKKTKTKKVIEPVAKSVEENIEEKQDESSIDNSDYYTEVLMKKNNDEDFNDNDEEINDNDEEINDNDEDNEMKNKKMNKYDDENVIGLNFFQALRVCLKKYFTIKGRASRSEYWFLQLLVTPTFTYIGFMSDAVSVGTVEPSPLFWLSIIVVFIFFIPSITCQIRRFHDINKSGWFILVNFIPFVGWLIALVMLVQKGTEGKNRFGNYPLKFKNKS